MAIHPEHMSDHPTLTIAVPSYSRWRDLDYLLTTIFDGGRYPDEILVIDDNSPDLAEIRKVVQKWRERFEPAGVNFVYQENPRNLGYDRNVRKLIESASSKYLVFIGNDDAFTSGGVGTIYRALAAHPGTRAFSRSFIKFSDTIEDKRGVSRFASSDTVFSASNSKPRFYLRLSAYFGGLAIDREWAISKQTECYDGTLYYQVYLFGCAYYETGVAYIHEPVVGARVDGVPLFGSSLLEAAVHSPGGYSANARANMWMSVLGIARDIDRIYGGESAEDIHYELKTRLSFHVFESYSRRSIKDLLSLVRELKGLRLMHHPIPVFLFVIVLVFRTYSAAFFGLIRQIYQR